MVLPPIIATANPFGLSTEPSWNITPLLGVIVALWLTRFVVGLKLRPWTMVGAAVAGTLWAYAADWWGVPPLLIAGFVLVVAAARLARELDAR